MGSAVTERTKKKNARSCIAQINQSWIKEYTNGEEEPAGERQAIYSAKRAKTLWVGRGCKKLQRVQRRRNGTRASER